MKLEKLTFGFVVMIFTIFCYAILTTKNPRPETDKTANQSDPALSIPNRGFKPFSCTVVSPYVSRCKFGEDVCFVLMRGDTGGGISCQFQETLKQLEEINKELLDTENWLVQFLGDHDLKLLHSLDRGGK